MPNTGIRYADGTFDFSSGVNGARVPTVVSSNTPHGLPRSALAWMMNATTRGGGIQPRYGWKLLVPDVSPAALYQGGYLYEPSGANPYLILSIAGNIFMVNVDAPYTITNLSALSGLANPVDQPLGFFEQAEEFLVIQAGDGVTKPLFWSGTALRRSNGVTSVTDPSDPNVSELPAAGPMVYYANRLWYAQDRIYTAGDIARGAAGTVAYNRRDSVLRVTENPLAFGGDGFSVPTNSGNIRSLTYPANIDTNLGQGPLLIGTRKNIFSMTVPVSRTDWTSAGNNQPLQVVAQIKYGPVGDRSMVHVNGDNFYQTLEPAIRSFAFARRSYGQWANTPISGNVKRLVRRNDRALLRYSTGINWDNRLWQSALPEQTAMGVIHKATSILEFDPLSSLEEQLPPVWEGHYEGLPVLQYFEGDFGGLQRAFAVIANTDTGAIEVWELTREDLTENGDNRIVWSVESPAWTWASSIGELELKKLVGGELHFDQIYGKSTVTVEYRPDAYPCWLPWSEFEVCSARNSSEDPYILDYPEQPYLSSYQSPKALPNPPAPCIDSVVRPANIGLQFQVRITVRGWLRIRALILFAEWFERQPYHGIVC